MDKQPVGQLPDLAQSNNDDEIMVITNSEYSQLKKEKISDLITDFTSTNENNALTKGTDGKMFVTDFGNASNITEGTLPTSVLPDIPKSKLPDIETADLPLSGVTADTYAYPSSVTVNAQGQVTAIEEGSPSGANANTDLSNITDAGKEVIKDTVGYDDIQTSLSDIQTSLSNKADKTDVDGQWVYKSVNLSNNYSNGTTVVDLSDELPNDGYNYEILISCGAQGKNQAITSQVFFTSSIIENITAIGLSGSSVYQFNTFNIPVGTDRTLSITKTGQFVGIWVDMYGYRRLGKNN